MVELFTNGRIIDLILLLVVLEIIFIALYQHKTQRGIRLNDLISHLLAGIFLMLALRCALVSAGWEWIALCLVCALLAHLADLYQRWPRQEGANSERANSQGAVRNLIFTTNSVRRGPVE